MVNWSPSLQTAVSDLVSVSIICFLSLLFFDYSMYFVFMF